MKQIALPFLIEQPSAPPPPARTDPPLWVSRLLLLREPRISGESVIRDIRLRRGLNILWAPPSDGGAETRLFDGKITGHTAGKTTFCRLIRYLLGEERFGAPRAQDRIRERLPEGWVVGEVVIGGVRWVVGRPFARGLHPFAAQGRPVEEALLERGPYQDFRATLEAAIMAPVPVKSLPRARRPLDWDVLLTWLSRDQEARFAGLVHFRDPSSESTSPSPTLGDRYVVVRAVLGLMSDEERAIQEEQESVAERRRQIEAEGQDLRRRADEDRRRLAKRLGLKDDGEAGPLFAARLREAVEARRATVRRAEEELAGRRAAAELSLAGLIPAAEQAGALRRRLEEAEERLARARSAAQDTVGATHPSVDGGDPDTIAVENHPVDGAPEGDRVEAIAREVLAAREALGAAREAERALMADFVRLNGEAQEERARAAREGAIVEELDRLEGHAAAARRAREAGQEAAQGLAREARELAERKATQRREHAEALERLSGRFEYVAQALLGRKVSGEVDVSGGEVALRLDMRGSGSRSPHERALRPAPRDHGERDGAAMETVKVLAFDLAALALGIDGYGHFPAFLIHDGPREADMDSLIYERLFLYARELEEKPGGGREPAFQYIVTTTAPPPKRT